MGPPWSAEAQWPASVAIREFLGLTLLYSMPWLSSEEDEKYAQRVGAYVRGTRFQLVEEILADEDEAFPLARKSAGAREGLYDALEAHIAKMWRVLEKEAGVFCCDEAPEFENGILALDERFAAYIEGLGEAGKGGAAKLRDRARARIQELEAERQAFNAPDAVESRNAELRRLDAELASCEIDAEGYRARLSDMVPAEDALAFVAPSDAEETRAEVARLLASLEAGEISDIEFHKRCPRQVHVRLSAPIGAQLLEEWSSTYDGSNGVSRILRTLAIVLWRDVVGPRLENERKSPAGLAKAVCVDVLDLATKRYDVKKQGKQQTLTFPDNRGWVLVPSVFDEALDGILGRGVDLLSSELGIDLLEWEVTAAHAQWAAGEPDFRRIRIEGGYSALAHDYLGRSSKSDADRVRAIIYAQAHMQFQTYGVRGNLLSYAEPQKAARGRKSVVTLTLGDMLLYGYAQELREKHGATSLSSREARRLVPILGKTVLVGRTNDHAAQRRMVWRLAILLRDNAAELAKSGAVRIPLERWAQLADEAAMPRSRDVLWRVLDSWKAGSDKIAPLLEQTGKDTFTLHTSRKEALDFLVESGKRTLRKTAEGKASARNRAASRRKAKE